MRDIIEVIITVNTYTEEQQWLWLWEKDARGWITQRSFRVSSTELKENRQAKKNLGRQKNNECDSPNRILCGKISQMEKQFGNWKTF